MTSATANADATHETLRQRAIYAHMRWRDKTVRAIAAYRAWVHVGTEGAWQAYEDAFTLEQGASLHYVTLAERLGDHAELTDGHAGQMPSACPATHRALFKEETGR